MATSSSCLSVHRVISIAVVAVALSACSKGAERQPEQPAGRFAVINVPGIGPGTTETIELDTATGATWQLVKITAPGAYGEIGWHPIADLTIESRTPYYRHTPQQRQQGGR